MFGFVLVRQPLAPLRGVLLPDRQVPRFEDDHELPSESVKVFKPRAIRIETVYEQDERPTRKRLVEAFRHPIKRFAFRILLGRRSGVDRIRTKFGPKRQRDPLGTNPDDFDDRRLIPRTRFRFFFQCFCCPWIRGSPFDGTVHGH